MKKIFTPIMISIVSLRCMASGNDSISTASLPEAMTLHACMEYAIEYSTKNEIQNLDNADTRIDRREAILKTFTPAIEAGTYAYSNFGRAVDPETNTYTNTTSFNNGYSLSASLTLFNGFSAINNIRISKTAVKMGLSQEDRLRDELCLAVMEAYFNVLYHTEMTEVLRKQIEVSKASLQLMKKQYELGQKSYPDVAQMEAELADREYQYTTSSNSSEDALLTLKLNYRHFTFPLQCVPPEESQAYRRGNHHSLRRNAFEIRAYNRRYAAYHSRDRLPACHVYLNTSQTLHLKAIVCILCLSFLLSFQFRSIACLISNFCRIIFCRCRCKILKRLIFAFIVRTCKAYPAPMASLCLLTRLTFPSPISHSSLLLSAPRGGLLRLLR